MHLLPSQSSSAQLRIRRRPASVLWLRVLMLVAVAVTLQACSSPSQPKPTPTSVPPTPTPGVVRTAFISVTIVPGDGGEERLVDRIEPRPGSIQVLAGREVQLQARAFDQFGQPFPGAPLVWNVLNPNAGRVRADGLFQAGHQPETYENAVQVSASESAISITRLPALATIAVEVLPPREAPEIDKLRVLPSPVVAQPRQIVTLNALAESAGGIPIDAEVTWSLSTESLGRINPLGYFTVMAPPGVYQNAIQVTAKQGDQVFSQFIDLQVVQAQAGGNIVSISLLPGHVRLSPNQPFQFQAIALDSIGQVLSSADISWSVADGQAGSIDTTGLFKASERPGVYAKSVMIEATHRTEGRLTRKRTFATVVIKEPPSAPKLQSISVRPVKSAVPRGMSVLFSAAATDQNGKPMAGQQFSWAMDDPRPGQIDSNGVLNVTGPPGNYDAAVRVATRSTEEGEIVVREAWADVVIIGPLDQIAVQPTELLIQASQSRQLVVESYDLNGVPVRGVIATWEMANPEAGAISGNTGVFVASQQPGYYPNAIRVTARDSSP